MNFFRALFSKRVKKERSPRIRLLLSDGAKLETPEGVFAIVNLSETGLSVIAENSALPTRTSGKLVLSQEAVPIDIEVVRRNGGQLGARFLGDVQPVRSLLRRIFRDEMKATEMSEIDAAYLAREESGAPRWFYAPGNYELFLLEANAQVVRAELGWNDRIVVAATGVGARSGTIPAEVREEPTHKKSALVRWDSALAEADRSKAVRIVENIPGIEPGLRGQIVSLFRA